MIPPPLAADAVHVWCGPDEAASPGALLDAAERAQAARFVYGDDRRRFVRTHGWVRRVLGAYRTVPPAMLRFTRGPFGKPALDGISFNLSHAGEVALLAVAAEAVAVGIDVERVRPLADIADMVRQCFAPEEAAVWRALPPAEKMLGFFRLWTFKEAFVKATGEGLSRRLDSFAVSLGSPPALLRPHVAGWSLHDVPAPPGHVAALACSTPGAAVRQWRLTLAGEPECLSDTALP